MHPWNTPLFEALKARAERFPHALLIHGVRGTGKLALAERVAQFLLCEHAGLLSDDESRRHAVLMTMTPSRPSLHGSWSNSEYLSLGRCLVGMHE